MDMKGGDGAAAEDFADNADSVSEVSSLQERGNLEIERCFQHLADVLVDGSWTLAARAEEGGNDATVSYMDSNDGSTCWARLAVPNYELNYDDKIWSSHPEIMDEFDVSIMMRVKVLTLLAPGDAIIRLEFGSPEVTKSVASVAGSLYMQARWTLRKHFPRSGITSLVLAPPNSSGFTLSSKFTMLFYFLDVRSHPDGRGFTVNHYMQLPWPQFPDWAAPNLLEMSKIEKQRFRPDDELYQHMRKYYVVLSLQSCARGPPLMPTRRLSAALDIFSSDSSGKEPSSVQTAGFYWATINEGEFNFPMYLSKFFEVLGYRTAVWDSLSGRFLVPYQAVIRGSDWAQVSEEFTSLFQAQRAVYRRTHGGRSAPKVRLGREPHYLDLWTTEVPSWEDNIILERNTFLKVAKVCPVRRAAEYP